jgi:indolepyruvate ferredoxin oxidoreductase
VRLAPKPQDLHQIRIDRGTADALIACDMVVGTSDKVLPTLRKGGTRIVINEDDIPTADHVLFRDADTDAERRFRLLRNTVGSERLDSIDANRAAQALMGDTVFTNIIMLGYAWQRGLVPVRLDALRKAIELNGVAVDRNLTALNWGRLAAGDEQFVQSCLTQCEGPAPRIEPLTLEEQKDYLAQYQNKDYADLFASRVQAFAPENDSASEKENALYHSVRHSLFKLMAYKDEYEVARLYAETDFAEQIARQFEGDYTLSFNLAPPLLDWRKDASGRPRKVRFGPWMMPAFKVLAKMRFLRGTPFDPFARSRDRKLERKLLHDYLSLLDVIRSGRREDNLDLAIRLARLPEAVRGFGPVKEAAIAEFYADRDKLLRQFDSAGRGEELDARRHAA